MRKTKRIIFWALGLSVVYICILLLWFNYVSLSERAGKVSKCDVAVVLMGEVNQDFTDIGQQTQRRLNYALQLWQDGIVDSLMCVGGSRPSRQFSGAEMMRQYLVRNGVVEKEILVETQSYDTRTNIKNAAVILTEEKINSIVLVSSPLHIHRIRKMKELKYMDGLNVQFSTFDYDKAQPPLQFIDGLRHAHYEWMSYAISALPDQVYQRIVRKLREQSE